MNTSPNYSLSTLNAVYLAQRAKYANIKNQLGDLKRKRKNLANQLRDQRYCSRYAAMELDDYKVTRAAEIIEACARDHAGEYLTAREIFDQYAIEGETYRHIVAWLNHIHIDEVDSMIYIFVKPEIVSTYTDKKGNKHDKTLNKYMFYTLPDDINRLVFREKVAEKCDYSVCHDIYPYDCAVRRIPTGLEELANAILETIAEMTQPQEAPKPAPHPTPSIHDIEKAAALLHMLGYIGNDMYEQIIDQE